jgi:hypothetical protein
LFVLPLVNVPRWRARLDRWFRQAARTTADALGTAAPGTAAAAAIPGACGLCGADPITLPYAAAPCTHRFCYVCIRTAQMADDGGVTLCPTCSAPVHALGRAPP